MEESEIEKMEKSDSNALVYTAANYRLAEVRRGFEKKNQQVVAYGQDVGQSNSQIPRFLADALYLIQGKLQEIILNKIEAIIILKSQKKSSCQNFDLASTNLQQIKLKKFQNCWKLSLNNKMNVSMKWSGHQNACLRRVLTFLLFFVSVTLLGTRLERSQVATRN